jgi:hypothetical protein
MSPNQDRPSPSKPAPIEGTRLDSDDEIRQTLQARRAQLAAQPENGPLHLLIEPVELRHVPYGEAERPVMTRLTCGAADRTPAFPL